MIYKNRKKRRRVDEREKLWQNENYLDSFDPGTFNLHKKGFYCNTQDQGLKGNYNFDLKTN